MKEAAPNCTDTVSTFICACLRFAKCFEQIHQNLSARSSVRALNVGVVLALDRVGI